MFSYKMSIFELSMMVLSNWMGWEVLGEQGALKTHIHFTGLYDVSEEISCDAVSFPKVHEGKYFLRTCVTYRDPLLSTRSEVSPDTIYL